MPDLNKVVLCLEKITSKNLGQNPGNLKHFLMKDFNYWLWKSYEIDWWSNVANIIKSVIFKGKGAFRIIRADSNKTVVPETQEDNSHVVQNDVIEDRNCCTETGVIEDSQTPPDDQQISKILTIVEKRFMKIEDHMIGLSNPIFATSPNTTRQLLHKFITKSDLWIGGTTSR